MSEDNESRTVQPSIKNKQIDMWDRPYKRSLIISLIVALLTPWIAPYIPMVKDHVIRFSSASLGGILIAVSVFYSYRHSTQGISWKSKVSLRLLFLMLGLSICGFLSFAGSVFLLPKNADLRLSEYIAYSTVGVFIIWLCSLAIPCKTRKIS